MKKIMVMIEEDGRELEVHSYPKSVFFTALLYMYLNVLALNMLLAMLLDSQDAFIIGFDCDSVLW